MNESLGTRLITAARGRALVTVLLVGASFIAQVGIARRFGLLGLGEYTATALVVFIAAVVFASGVPLATSRVMGAALEARDEATARDSAATGFAVAIALSFLASAVVWSSWDWLMEALGVDGRVPAAAAFAATLAAGALHYVPSVFQARLQMATVGLISIAQPTAVIAALLADRAYPGIAPATMAVIGYVAGGAVSIIAFIAAGFRPYIVRDQVIALVRMGPAALPLSYANVFAAWTDRLLVSVILGPVGLGIYQGAFAVVDGALRLPRAAASFLVLAYARVSTGRPEELDRMLRLHVRIWVAYAAVLAAGLIAGADGIVTTVFGFGWGDAAAPLGIMAVALAPGMVVLSVATAATGRGAMRVPLYAAATTVPLQVIFMLVLATRFGVIGAASAYLLVTLSGLAGYWWWGHKRRIVTGEVRLSLTLGHAAAAAAIAAALMALPLPWPVRMGLAALVAAGVSLRLLGSEERVVLRTLVQGFWPIRPQARRS